MMFRSLRNKTVFLLAVAFAAVAGGLTTGIVLAAIPDSNGQIHACRGNIGGYARIIDTANQQCSGLETPVSWSESGGAGDGAKAYAYVEYNVDEEDNLNIVARPGFSEHIAGLYKGENGALCLNFDTTVTNPKQIFINSTSMNDGHFANLEALIGATQIEFWCPQGADAFVNNGSGENIFLRVY